MRENRTQAPSRLWAVARDYLADGGLATFGVIGC